MRLGYSGSSIVGTLAFLLKSIPKLSFTFSVRMYLLKQLRNELCVGGSMVLPTGDETIKPVRRRKGKQLGELRAFILIELWSNFESHGQRLR